MSVIASAIWLIGLPESAFCICGVCANVGNVLLAEMCLNIFRGCLICSGNGLFEFEFVF